MFDLFEILLAISPFAVICLIWFCWKLNRRIERLESMMIRKHLSRSFDMPKSAPDIEPDIEPDNAPWTGMAAPPASTAPPGSSVSPGSAVPPEIPTRPSGHPKTNPQKTLQKTLQEAQQKVLQEVLQRVLQEVCKRSCFDCRFRRYENTGSLLDKFP